MELDVMSMLHKIKQGVQESDWQLVCDGYFEIVGEKLEPPTQPKTPLEQLQSMVNKPPAKTNSTNGAAGKKKRQKKVHTEN